MTSVILVVADNMKQGNAVIKYSKLKLDSCAVITNPEYFDEIKLHEDEIIYAHAAASTELFNGLNHKISESGRSINIRIVNP